MHAFAGGVVQGLSDAKEKCTFASWPDPQCPDCCGHSLADSSSRQTGNVGGCIKIHLQNVLC